jgi:hypothetical protein
MARAFTYEMVELDDISATDLHDAGVAGCINETIETERGFIHPFGTLMAAYRITADEYPETVQAVVISAEGGYRIGIAWGGDADWADLPTAAEGNDDPDFDRAVSEAIDLYLNDYEAFEARN